MQRTSFGPDTERGRALAERGDWHAAAIAFEAALAGAERRGDAVALAVALTNLGQARAYVGALDDATTLLARAAAERDALVERGVAGRAVAARGHAELAAVQAAAEDYASASIALERASAALGVPEAGSADAALAVEIEAGLALIRRARGPAPAATSPRPR